MYRVLSLYFDQFAVFVFAVTSLMFFINFEDFHVIPWFYLSHIESPPTRMVYLKHDIRWRYTNLVGNPQYILLVAAAV